MAVSPARESAGRAVVTLPLARGACIAGAAMEWVLVETPAGGWSVIEGTCSHRGGPLRLGTCDARAVRCPWHGTAFSWSGLIRRGAPAIRVGAVVRAVVPDATARAVQRRVYLAAPGEAGASATRPPARCPEPTASPHPEEIPA
ncbi:Rieske 2Fe-2S domain-containing protein [Salinarimonas chemoclinalis]|uniref:Rieske 2Fe-2S domain-containing protein n=1 Tax=Salinarimonas chemoclinalis TaxID=3241599 RepID=UPI003558BB3A